MKSLKDWCKHCFGMKTVETRTKQELEDIKQELFTAEKEYTWLIYRIKYLNERKELLE